MGSFEIDLSLKFSGHFQAGHRSSRGGELVYAETLVLQGADLQFWQRIIVFLIECDVLAMLESAACE